MLWGKVDARDFFNTVGEALKHGIITFLNRRKGTILPPCTRADNDWHVLRGASYDTLFSGSKLSFRMSCFRNRERESERDRAMGNKRFVIAEPDRLFKD